jgi:hypothetical protein
MSYFRTHTYVGWDSYGSRDAVLLAIILIALAAAFTYVGARLKSRIGVRRPGPTVSGFMIAIWALALCTFVVAIRAYAMQLKQADLLITPPRPQVGTLPDAAVTFLIILYLTRGYGWRVALASAFVGTAAAPMFFELPFDLIVLGRTYPAIPPDPMLYRALFVLPLFSVELSTISLLTLLPSMRITRHALYVLAGMFACFDESTRLKALPGQLHPIQGLSATKRLPHVWDVAEHCRSGCIACGPGWVPVVAGAFRGPRWANRAR